MKKLVQVLPVAIALLMLSTNAFAQEESENLGAGLAMGLAVVGGGLGQGLTARGMVESVSRNPQAAAKLNAPFYVGMAFIESLCLFALVVAFAIS
jgi:F-type H+-transporting ATPase subunit c